jgi:hypothetical protein
MSGPIEIRGTCDLILHTCVCLFLCLCLFFAQGTASLFSFIIPHFRVNTRCTHVSRVHRVNLQ